MKRSLFNLSHEKLLTGNMGELLPVMCEMLAPGDVWRQNTNILLRTQPLLAPVMHKVDITVHHWAVPLRLLLDNWEDFITGGRDGLSAPTLPTITVNSGSGWAVGSLADYLGFPTGVDDFAVSAFPFRAYSLIWNEWYRDEQLQDPLTIDTTDGADTTTNTTLQNGSWGKDYFTAARPEPQLGTPVAIPLTGDAPVTGMAPVMGIGTDSGVITSSIASVRQYDGTTTTMNPAFKTTSQALVYAASATSTGAFPRITADADIAGATMEADLSSVSAINIDELREASAIQRFKEMMNRTGARYTEYLRQMFRINPQDSRLQLPEYLGGGKATIQFSEVLQTSSTPEDGTPLAALGGHGIAAGKSNRFKYFAQEHCVIMTLLCVRPKTVYSQGIRRQWMYQTKYDFLIPQFANLGDQEVYKGEIYAQNNDATNRETWGYTPKYDEYRYIPNTIAGEFKSTLDYWHFARIFESYPALNAAFVKAVPSTEPYAVTTEDQLQIRAIHNVKVKRALPKVANPLLY